MSFNLGRTTKNLDRYAFERAPLPTGNRRQTSSIALAFDKDNDGSVRTH